MDVTLSPAAIAILRRTLAVDDRDADPVPLDVGFSSVVFRFGNSVVKVARNDDARRAYAREVPVLAALDGRLPVAVAAPGLLVDPTDGLPFGALVQPFLPGRVMTQDDAVRRPALCEEIAEALAVLHRVERSAFPEGSLRHLDPSGDLDRLQAETAGFLERRLDQSRLAAARNLFDEARRGLARHHDRVVAHADPWYGNMLLDSEGRLSGLLDFEHTCVADPAFDLAAQTYLTPPSASAVLDAYEERAGRLVDRDARMHGYLVIREWWGLAYAVRNDMEDEIDHAMADVIALLG